MATDIFAQRELRENILHCYQELYGKHWGGMWRNFYARASGCVFVGTYGDVRLRDAFAVREVIQVLPLREMAVLVMDDPEARFPGDVVIIARPDLFASRHARRVLAEVHQMRRFFHLGRYAFINVTDGKCYWRARQGPMMREYGLVARHVRTNGHHVITVSGLSRIGTWAAAKSCSDMHYLEAVEGLLQPRLLEAAERTGKDPHNIGFEVLVEVCYEVEKHEREYLAQFDLDATLAPLITGVGQPPTYYEGPSGDVVREEDLMIRPIAVETELEALRSEHVVIALVKGDCPANAATDPNLITHFVVDGVDLVEKGTSRFNLMLQAWYRGPRSEKEFEGGEIREDRHFPAKDARTIRCQFNREANRSGVPGEVIRSSGHKYYINSLSQHSLEQWEHVDMPGVAGPPPGLSPVPQAPPDAPATTRRRRANGARSTKTCPTGTDPLG